MSQTSTRNAALILGVVAFLAIGTLATVGAAYGPSIVKPDPVTHQMVQREGSVDCGPTCAAIALSWVDVQATEHEMVGLVHRLNDGTSVADLATGLQAKLDKTSWYAAAVPAGVTDLFVKSRVSIIRYASANSGKVDEVDHFVVVAGGNGTTATLNDPLQDRARTVTVADIEALHPFAVVVGIYHR